MTRDRGRARPASPPHIRAASAAAVAAGSDLVVLAGGDGTVRDAVGPLAGTGIPIGIVPCGTGNLYATAVGIPRDLDQAIAAIRDGMPTPLRRRRGPAGRTPAGDGVPDRCGRSPRRFVVACGTGFDARLIAATSREAKRRYGVAAYFITASRLLGHLAPQPTVLTVDGVRTELESVVVLVANCGEAIPGRLRPRLPIDPDDGLLHVFVLPMGGILGGIRGALELMLAEAGGSLADRSRDAADAAREVRVEVTPAGPTQVDGDVFGSAPRSMPACTPAASR